MDLVELTMKVEDEFGVQVPDEEGEKMRSVEDVVDYVSERKREDGEKSK